MTEATSETSRTKLAGLYSFERISIDIWEQAGKRIFRRQVVDDGEEK